MVWAFVTCTRCINAGKWNQPLDVPCEICGANREFVFTPFKFAGTYVDVFNLCNDPMAAFTDWVIKFEQYELNNANEDVENMLGINLGPMREAETDSDVDQEENGEEEEDSSPDAKRRRILSRIFEQTEQDPEEFAANQRKAKKKSFRTIVYAHAGNLPGSSIRIF